MSSTKKQIIVMILVSHKLQSVITRLGSNNMHIPQDHHNKNIFFHNLHSFLLIDYTTFNLYVYVYVNICVVLRLAFDPGNVDAVYIYTPAPLYIPHKMVLYIPLSITFFFFEGRRKKLLKKRNI